MLHFASVQEVSKISILLQASTVDHIVTNLQRLHAFASGWLGTHAALYAAAAPSTRLECRPQVIYLEKLKVQAGGNRDTHHISSVHWDNDCTVVLCVLILVLSDVASAINWLATLFAYSVCVLSLKSLQVARTIQQVGVLNMLQTLMNNTLYKLGRTSIPVQKVLLYFVGHTCLLQCALSHTHVEFKCVGLHTYNNTYATSAAYGFFLRCLGDIDLGDRNDGKQTNKQHQRNSQVATLFPDIH